MNPIDFCQGCDKKSTEGTEGTITPCDKCNRVGYCSSKCQENDLPFHITFCQTIWSGKDDLRIFETYTATLLNNEKFIIFLDALCHLAGPKEIITCTVVPRQEEVGTILYCDIRKTNVSPDKLTRGHKDYVFKFQLADKRILNDYGCKEVELCAASYQHFVEEEKMSLLLLPARVVLAGELCFLARGQELIDL